MELASMEGAPSQQGLPSVTDNRRVMTREATSNTETGTAATAGANNTNMFDDDGTSMNPSNRNSNLPLFQNDVTLDGNSSVPLLHGDMALNEGDRHGDNNIAPSSDAAILSNPYPNHPTSGSNELDETAARVSPPPSSSLGANVVVGSSSASAGGVDMTPDALDNKQQQQDADSANQEVQQPPPSDEDEQHGHEEDQDSGELSSTSNQSRDKHSSNCFHSFLGLHDIHCRAVLASRLLFLFSLAAVAVVLAVLTYFFLTKSETDLAENQYSAQAERALEAAADITLRKRDGTVSMASIVAEHFARIEDWPFIALNGYEVISTNLIATSSGREMGLCPIVQPDQIPQFEAFAYDYFQHSRVPEPFPEGTGISSFGEGIWARGPNPNVPEGEEEPPRGEDGRYRVTSGKTAWDNTYEVVTPIMQHNAGAFPALMLNLFFERNRGKIIESLIDCSQERKQHAQQQSQEEVASMEECGGITDMLILTSQEVEPGPGALIMQPIYPARNHTELAGILASSIVWDEVLVNVFAEEVSGVDCVLETETLVYTYRIDRGVARYRGEGDLHDHKYNKYRRSVSLTRGNIFSQRSAHYTLTTYPSSDFFDVYSTRNPRIATIGSVLIMLLTSGLFILYDFFVRREFNVKQELLQAKRRFVRFISHEVRTPLNSVCMGLTLLQHDLTATLNTMRQQQANPSQDNIDNKKDDDAVSEQDSMKTENVSNWLEITDEIVLNARTSVDVLNDILNYDKIENNTLSMEYEPVRIWRLIHRTVQEFKIAAQQKSIKLELSFHMQELVLTSTANTGHASESLRDEPSSLRPAQDSSNKDNKDHAPEAEVADSSSSLAIDSEDEIPPSADARIALGDNVRLTQVFRNLISNAIKFTPQDGTIQVAASYKVKRQDELLLANNKGKRATMWPPSATTVSGASSTRAQRRLRNRKHKRRNSPSTAPTSHSSNYNANNNNPNANSSHQQQHQHHYEPAGHLKLKVADSGAGMTAEQCEKLFQEGVQFNVNSLQGGGGSGLGLFIAKGIVEQHNGVLTVASEGTSKGTTFTMLLPLFERQQDASEKEHHVSSLFPPTADADKAEDKDTSEPMDVKTTTDDPHQQVSFSMPGQPAPMHVLVVEDSAMNRKLLCRLIRSHGHVVVEAEDGQQAVDLVRETLGQDPETAARRFDTILMDYEMPVLNGPDATRQIRDLGCDSFVVGITGNVLPDDVAYFRNAGANSVLPKPFHMTDLEELWIEYGVVSTSTGVSGLRFQG